MATQLLQTFGVFINLYSAVLVVWCLMSFFPNVDREHPLVRGLESIVQPVLAPIRMILPTLGGLDFSPMVAMFLLNGLNTLLQTGFF